MKFPDEIRYDKVHKAVIELYENEDIEEFPINPYKIIKDNDWGLITYSELATKHNTSVMVIEQTFQSRDGYVFYDEKEGYTIAYNDTMFPEGRIRFTLMHEIGHIYLRHLLDYEETILTRGNLSKEQYLVLEDEANTFARNSIAPVPVVLKLGKRVQDIIKEFNMSKAAAATRQSKLKKDASTLLSDAYNFFLEKCKSFVNKKLYSKVCKTCSHTFYIEKSRFCPICGHNNFVRGDETNMIYEVIELDKNNRAIQCPTCFNEKVKSDICHICGTYLINKCTGYNDEIFTDDIARYNMKWHEENGCGEKLSGDARFCHKCTSISTFYGSGILRHWTDETNKRNANRAIMNGEKIPF